MNTNYKEEMEIDIMDLIWHILSRIGMIAVFAIAGLILAVGFKLYSNHSSNSVLSSADIDSAIEATTACLTEAELNDVKISKEYYDAIEQNKADMSTEIYMDSLKNLDTFVIGFTDDQATLFNYLIDKDQGITEIENAGSSAIRLTNGVIKYGIAGFAFGIILACALIVCMYITNGTVKTGEEMVKFFGLFLLGDYGEITEGKGFLEKLRRKQKWTLSEKRQLTIANIKVLCDKAGTDSIYMTTTLHMDQKEKDEVGKIADGLTERGIKVSIGENLLHDAGTLEQMSEFDNIVLIEKLNESRYEDVAKEMNIVNQQKLNVIGIAVL